MSSKWDKRFLKLAKHVSEWSKDPSTKVGCVLVNDDKQVISMGYNGFPRGVEDSDERLNDRSTKYLMVQHAEANTLTQAIIVERGLTAYVTHKPCANCTGLLIQSGVKRIVTTVPDSGITERFKDSFTASDLMISEADIEIEHYWDI